MRRAEWWQVLVAFLAVSLFAVGCDDSSSSEEGDQTVSDQVAETTPDVEEETSPDVTEEVDQVEEDQAEVEEDLIEADADMVEDQGGGEFEWPETPEDYVFNASYVNTLTVPELVDGRPTCCRDWGDSSKNDGIDNSISELTNALSLVLNAQDTLDEQLQAGNLALLFDHQSYNGTETDEFFLVGLFGSFADGVSYAQASAGGANFLVNPIVFKDGTGEPEIYFEEASLSAGALSAGPDTFQIALPIGDGLQVDVSDAVIEGQATVSSDGVSYIEGELSGYIEVAALVNAINAMVSSPTCECLGFEGDLYTLQPSGEITEECMDLETAEGLCTEEEEQVCVMLAASVPDSPLASCPLLNGIIANSADINLDNDPMTYEALSIGMEWTAVPANISGFQEVEE